MEFAVISPVVGVEDQAAVLSRVVKARWVLYALSD